VLVYTAVFGRYDARKIHVPQTTPTEYAYFDDDFNPYLPSELRDMHPRLKAKYYKLQPYAIPNYHEFDYVIWIDGSGTFISPRSVETLVGYCRQGYAVFRHPARDCIYDEVEFCQDFEKYRQQPLAQQVASYRQEGYPPHNGLYACGLIVRDTRKDFTALDADWLAENLRWSYQDQLSFPYVLWKLGRTVDVIDLDLVHNDYVTFLRDDWTR